MTSTLRPNLEKLKRKPVTLIVGIIAKDGIVVASDSQTTWGTGKSWDANKMTELRHPYGRALVAESGATITSAAVTEKLGRLASEKENLDQYSFSELGEMATRHVREKLRSQNFNCSAEELGRIIDSSGLDCKLMVVNHWTSGPEIFTIQLSIGISSRCKSTFEAVGSGSDLAQYILTDLCKPGLSSEDASVIAVHVVETVKRHDPFCGGPTKVGILKTPKDDWNFPHAYAANDILASLSMYSRPPLLLTDSEVEELTQLVSEVENTIRARRGEITRDALKKNTDRRIMEMLSRTHDTITETFKGIIPKK